MSITAVSKSGFATTLTTTNLEAPVITTLSTAAFTLKIKSRNFIQFGMLLFVYLAQEPPVGQGLLIHEVSRSHSTTHHSREDSSGRVIGSSQTPLPDTTQHSQQTNIHASGRIRTQIPSRRAAADRSFRSRDHRDRQLGM